MENNGPQPDAPERNLAERGLRTKVPKPNIIRVEILDGNARQRYLGTIQKFLDTTIKKAVYDKFVPANESVFYGFIKNQGTQGVSIGANWNGKGGSGGILGDIRGMIDKSASGSGALGLVSKLASTAISAGEKIESAAKSLGGFDANLTGSSSLKRVDSVEIGDFNVSCGWYLPEQLNLATASIQILCRMVYPRQVADKVFQQFIGDAATGVTQKTGELIRDNIPTFSGSGDATVPPKATDATQENIKATRNGFAGFVGDTAQGAAGLYTGFNSLVGRNLTLDPLPVRVSIGHYIDIEPMVITSLSIDFSKEQWVAPNGRHLPIFCDITLTFKSWLNPAPKVEFMQLLGTEMFGRDPHQAAIIKNIDDKNKREIVAKEDAAVKRQRDKSTIKYDAGETAKRSILGGRPF